MKKIILVQPIVGLLDNIKSAPGLPLSLLTAAKLVVQEYEVKIIDQRLDLNWRQTLINELKDEPLLVGTTAMLGPQIKFALEVCKIVKENSKVPTVWGGPFVSTLPEQAIAEANIDILVRGDGEITLLELARALDKGKSLTEVAGLYLKDKQGKVIKTTPRPLVDFNAMPDLPFDLVEVGNYLPKREGVPTIDLESSRGCPYACKFCYNPAFNLRQWRSIKPEVFLKRAEELKNKHSIRGIWLVDDEFFIDKNRARAIIEGLGRLNLQWEIQGVTAKSILSMDDEYLRMLEKSNCQQINIGAESGSDRILKMVNKGITVQDIIDTNLKLKPYNIMPWYYFMIGFPSETQEEQEQTISLVMKLLKENPKAKISGIGCFTPYPGTELFEIARGYGYQPPKRLIDWATYAVDQINIPWLTGKMRKKVETIQFSSFFVDQKSRDVAGAWWVKLLAWLYRPIARFRFSHHFYSFPLDAAIGNVIKRRLAK